MAKAGISVTSDKDNQNSTGLGDVRRTRIGGDLSFSVARVEVEGEIISIYHDLNVPGTSLDKQFYYGAIGYNFSDQVFGYFSYNFIKDDFFPGIENGVGGFYIGAGYRPSDSIVIKTQYIYLKNIDGKLPPPTSIFPKTDYSLKINFMGIGISVSL